MKKLLSFLLLVLGSCNPYKQFVTNKGFPAPFQFTEIDTLQASKDQLFTNAYEWMAKTFVKSDEKILMHDRAPGKLIGTAYIETPLLRGGGDSIHFGPNDLVYYTMSIDIQDGKYRCILSDFHHVGGERGRAKDGSILYRKSYGSLDRQTIADTTQPIRYAQWFWIKNYTLAQSKEIFKSLRMAMRKNDTNWGSGN